MEEPSRSPAAVVMMRLTQRRLRQHCFCTPRPPNFGLSRHGVQTPQSTAKHGPHDRQRTRFGPVHPPALVRLRKVAAALIASRALVLVLVRAASMLPLAGAAPSSLCALSHLSLGG